MELDSTGGAAAFRRKQERRGSRSRVGGRLVLVQPTCLTLDAEDARGQAEATAFVVTYWPRQPTRSVRRRLEPSRQCNPVEMWITGARGRARPLRTTEMIAAGGRSRERYR